MKACTKALVFLILLATGGCTPNTSKDIDSNDSLVQDSLIADTAIYSPSESAGEENKIQDTSGNENFVLLYSENGEQQWDPAFLSMRDAGITTLFFSSDKEVFGNAVGFDMDSYYLRGTYERLHDEDGNASGQNISITGEVIVYIEGEGVLSRTQLSNSGVQVYSQDGKTLLSSDFSFSKQFNKSAVTRQSLTKEELTKARESLVVF